MEVTFSPVDFRSLPEGEIIGIDWCNEAACYIRRPPLFIYDPDHVGLCDPIAAVQKIQRTPVYCLRLRDARLLGYRSLVTADGRLILDEYLPTEKDCERQAARFCDTRSPLMHEETGFVMRDGRLSSDKLDGPTVEIADPTVLLASIEPSNYGSWLFRILPKIATARVCGLMGLKFAVWCPMKWQLDLLESFGIGVNQIIPLDFSRVYRFNKIYAPSLRNPECYLDLATINLFDDCLAHHKITRGGKRRVYISRRNLPFRPEGTRQFVDEAEFEELLKSMGFDIVAPDRLPLIEQMRLFASSEIIVGGSGSGLFNAVFMTPGAHLVDIEAFPFWLHAHANLFSSTSLSYSFIVGNADDSDAPEVHKRWNVRVGQAAARVEELVKFVNLER